MKIGIYVNKSKDVGSIWSNKLKTILEKQNIEYSFIEDGNFSLLNPVPQNIKEENFDVIIVLGGDGTILGISSFAAKNNIKIVGINAGKLGFLTEFETFEMEACVEQIINNKLKVDKRILIEAEVNGKTYTALNDCVFHRIFDESHGDHVCDISVFINGGIVDKIVGDGVIISTPTGSTAYSLSAGGPILQPGIDSFCITPLSAHSLHNKPMVYNANFETKVLINEGNSALVLDGRFVTKLNKNDEVTIKKSCYSVDFLRKKDSNFYDRLILKLNKGQNE